MDDLINIYEELGIPNFSDEAELKKGLKNIRVKLHPDNHINAPVEVQKENAERLGTLCQICDYLSVPEQKEFYDNCLRKLDEVEDKNDFIHLMQKRCDLESKLLRRKFELISAFYDSDTCLSLVKKEQEIGMEIISCNRKKRALSNKINIVKRERNFVCLANIPLDMSITYIPYSEQYDIKISKLETELEKLIQRISELCIKLGETQKQINNFDLDSYCMQDGEYVKIFSEIEQIISELNNFRKKHI